MKGKLFLGWCVSLCLTLGVVARAGASVTLFPQPQPVSVVMMSDFHFDPFRDPAKVPALRAAPVMQWTKILDDPDSTTQAADYAALQTACHARGVDSSWGVLESTLKAVHAQQPSPLFVTVTGDLLTHNFDCRLKTLMPDATPADVTAFAAKTVEFLAKTLHDSFPNAPVYLALGNNDSGCTNYKQSSGSPFVKEVSRAIALDFTKPSDENFAVRAFSERGDYSVLLPHSMRRTRLVVLQDVFQAPAFKGCDGEPTQNVVNEQNKWLREQLLAAKREHQTVWVMAHIPPGIDTYASFHKFVAAPAKMCSQDAPTMLLQSDDLARTITDFAPIVKLAIFAHTHMDEIKLLHNEQGAAVPAKLIPSVSPVNGNTPAFVVAKVQPNTAVMLDYAVYAASNVKATSWSEQYRFTTAYGMPDFSADSVSQVASRLAKDKSGTDPMSQTYQRWFFSGDNGEYARGLKAVWPGYACAITEDGGPVFQECMCPAKAEKASTKAGQ